METCPSPVSERSGLPKIPSETMPEAAMQSETKQSFEEDADSGELPTLELAGTDLWIRCADALEQHDEITSNASSCASDDGASIADLTGDGAFEADDDSNDESMEAVETYDPLPEEQLSAVWLELQRLRLPSIDIAKRLVHGAAKLWSSEPSLVRLGRPLEGSKLVVVGDLHGHFGDFMHIMNQQGMPRVGPHGVQYLFNGDIVDRGVWGPEVLLSVFCLKLLEPGAVHVNRGNHEDRFMNIQPTNGFRDHCSRAFPGNGDEFYELCLRSFKQLPLCHVVGEEICIMHGGLPLDRGVTLAEIAKIRRRRRVPIAETALNGYGANQLVKAKRQLLAEDGTVIKAGTVGNFVRRGINSRHIETSFARKRIQVQVMGAPELETDVEICFDSAETQALQRENRLFCALLWSDPCKSRSAPSTRGAGVRFDAAVTEEFCNRNELRCILRSHEKRSCGFREEHVSSARELLAATVFSASNYPSGAGEPEGGNMASIVVLNWKPCGAPLSHKLIGAPGWHELYTTMNHWTGPAWRTSMIAMLHEASEKSVELMSTKDLVLQQTRRLIYCRRGMLLARFQKVDEGITGFVNLELWVQVMRTCLIKLERFPWKELAPYLASFESDGRCRYAQFLARYENVLSKRLAEQFYGPALLSLQGVDDAAGTAAALWDRIDKDLSGELSFEELRTLLASKNSKLSAEVENERVFSIFSSLDTSRNGFVERDEFIQAVACSRDAETTLASEQSVQRFEACWSAIQGVMVLLCGAHVRIETVFRLIDTDGSDSISRKEFEDGLRKLLQGTRLLATMDDWGPVMWSLLDYDGSGHISPKEFASGLAIEDTTEEVAKSRRNSAVAAGRSLRFGV